MRIKFLDDLPRDKLLHCLIGVWVFGAVQYYFGIDAAMIAVFVVGIGIEIQQVILKSGKFEILDMVAVWVGGLMGLGCAL